LDSNGLEAIEDALFENAGLYSQTLFHLTSPGASWFWNNWSNFRSCLSDCKEQFQEIRGSKVFILNSITYKKHFFQEKHLQEAVKFKFKTMIFILESSNYATVHYHGTN